MDKKNIYFKTENNNFINKKYLRSSLMTNIVSKLPKRSRTSLNYSKLKFNQNILINLLKKTNLKKQQNYSQTKLNYIPSNKKYTNLDFKIAYNLNKKFHDLPVVSKFHNITDEKINELIKSNNNNRRKSLNLKKTNNNIKTNINKNTSKKNYINFVCQTNNDKNMFIVKNMSRMKSKKLKIRLSELNSNFTNSLSNLKNNNRNINYNNNNSTSNKKDISHSNLNKQIKLNKTNINLEPIKSIDLYRRGSIVDRLVFYIEKPDECFEENLTDEKPSDKYQMFKNQINKHKDKLDKILKEIKLNQIKSEYLMKKYIFELMSRKKKIY